MGGSVGPSSGEADTLVDMNVIPLIDIMLVLLIMFIISLPIQTHAVKLDMPRPNDAEQQAEPVVIQLDVDFDGTILWNGSVVASNAQLRAYLQSISLQEPQPGCGRGRTLEHEIQREGSAAPRCSICVMTQYPS